MYIDHGKCASFALFSNAKDFTYGLVTNQCKVACAHATARSSLFCSKLKFTSEIWHRFLNRYFTAPMFRFLDKVATASHVLQWLSCVVLRPYYWFCDFYRLYSRQTLLSTNEGARIVTVMVNI